jgi:hypothetical protein
MKLASDSETVTASSIAGRRRIDLLEGGDA